MSPPSGNAARSSSPVRLTDKKDTTTSRNLDRIRWAETAQRRAKFGGVDA